MKPRKIVEMKIDEIIPYQNNAKNHPQEQINLLANAIAEFGFNQPIVIDANRIIIAGHGRYAAALKMGLPKVPVIQADDLTPAQVKAARISDNKLAELALWDDEKLRTDLQELQELDFDVSTLGFDPSDLESLLGDLDTTTGGGDGEEEDTRTSIYTQNVLSPVYVPTGEKPPLADLLKTDYHSQLIKGIEASDLPAEEKAFLVVAAFRHVVFNYQEIANYYAHSDHEMQSLMEDSFLVIIDFSKALEKGFAVMTKNFETILEDIPEDGGWIDED